MKPLDLKRIQIDRETGLWFAGLLLVPVVLYFLLVSPKMKVYQAINKQHQARVELIRTKDVKAIDLTKGEEANARMRKELSLLNQRFIKPGELTEFLNHISVLAEACRCLLDTVNVVESDANLEGVVQEKRVHLNLTGSYASLGDFLKKIETHEKLIKIDRFNMSSGDSDLGLSLTLDLILYGFALQSLVPEGAL